MSVTTLKLEGRLDTAALASALALIERPQDAVAGIHAAGVVRDGRAADLRRLWIERASDIEAVRLASPSGALTAAATHRPPRTL